MGARGQRLEQTCAVSHGCCRGPERACSVHRPCSELDTVRDNSSWGCAPSTGRASPCRIKDGVDVLVPGSQGQVF